jgi:hypothetical protein
VKTQSKLYIGEHNSGKTSVLLDFYLNAINNGNSRSANIIVIVRNKTLEHQLKSLVLEKITKPLEQLNIFRFRSFVNKIVTTYWSYLYKYPPVILGFAGSIAAMKYFLSLNPGLFEDAWQDKALLIKLYEREQRRVENCLSFADLKIRTEKLEQSSLALNANNFLEAYHQWIIDRERPLFDYSAQLDCFVKLSEINEVMDRIAADYNYAWLIDDIDEAIPAEQRFYEKLWGKSENLVYTGNMYGGVRQFMGSDPDYILDLQKKAIEVKTLEVEKGHKEKSLYSLGASIYNILVNNSHEFQGGHSEKEASFELFSNVSYSRMLEQLKEIFTDLHKKNINPEAVTVVSWNINDQLQLEIESQLKELDFRLDTVKGSQVLTKTPLINVLLTLLRIIFAEEINSDKKIQQLTAFDFSQLLYITGNIDNFYLAKLRAHLKNDASNWLKFIADYSQKDGFKTVKALNDVINFCRERKGKLVYSGDYRDLVIYLWKNLLWNNDDFKEKKGFNELKIFLDMLEKNIETGIYLSAANPIIIFIQQLLSGELSDNPDRAIDLKPGHIKLLTLQRLSEIKHSTPIQIWLDITADRWLKNDNHQLLNPNLLSQRWPLDKQWSLIEEEDLIEQKLAKSLRLSLSLCQEKAYFLAADYNVSGELQTYDFIWSFLKRYNS